MTTATADVRMTGGIRVGGPEAEAISPLRRGVFAYLACVLSTTALFSVLHGSQWFTRSLGGITLVAVIGIGGRAFGLSRWPIAAIQTVVALEYLVVSFASAETWRGVFPTRAAIHRIGHLSTTARSQLDSLNPPVHPSLEITFAAVAAASIVAVMVDVLAMALRQRALAGAPLLLFELVPITFQKESWWLFLPPAVAFLLLLSETRDRLAPRVGFAVLSVSLVVPAVTPHVNGKYEIRHGVGIGHGTITTLNPLVTMRQDLRQSTDVDLLTVHTNSQHPGDLYLRAVTLDRFDGVEWKADKREVRNFDSKLPDVTGLSPAVFTTPVDTQINVSNQFEADYLPMPFPPLKVNVDGQWRLDPLTENVVSHNGRGQITGRHYTVDSLDMSPSPTDVGATVPIDAYLQPYLQLPNLPPAVKQTAERVARGMNGPLEIGTALQEWFRRPGNFTYDLTVRSGTGSPDILNFLAVRRGYCEQFAATMAAMARLLGVPARVDVGFTSGRVADDGVNRIVSAHDAHAWPELWLPNIGWTRFEPTPGSASSNPAEPSWLAKQHPNPEQTNNSNGNETAPPQQPGAAPPAAGGAGSAGAQYATAGQFTCAAAPAPCQVKPPDPPEPEHHRWPILWAALVCLLFALLLGPGLTRALIRRRRWATAAGPRSTGPDAAGAAEIAWRELRDGAVDLGHVWPTARTPRQCATALAAEGALSNVGTAALHQVTTTVERTRYARQAAGGANADQLRTAVIRIHFELGRNAGRKWRIRAVVLPMSLRPLVPMGAGKSARGTRRTKSNPAAALGSLLRRRAASR